MAENTEPKVGTETTPPVNEKKTSVDYEAEMKKLQAEIEKLKSTLSDRNSDVANWKRRYNENVDAQKQAEIAAKEKAEKEAEELEMLRKNFRITGYKSKLMEAGVDSATADLMANALPEGVSDEYFTATKNFLSNQRQAIEAETLKKQPGLSVGMPPTAADAEKERQNKLRHYMGLPPLK